MDAGISATGGMPRAGSTLDYMMFFLILVAVVAAISVTGTLRAVFFDGPPRRTPASRRVDPDLLPPAARLT